MKRTSYRLVTGRQQYRGGPVLGVLLYDPGLLIDLIKMMVMRDRG